MAKGKGKEIKKDDRVVVFPDYIEEQSAEVKAHWLEWERLDYEIRTYPERIQSLVSPVTGETKDFDCMTPVGVMRRSLKTFNAKEEDRKRVLDICSEMQKLKAAKGHATVRWKRELFGKAKTGISILELRSAELVDYFGKYFTVSEVAKVIRKEWGLAITTEQLKEFYQSRKDKIERKRAEYVIKGKETRLATDAGRMEVLSNLAWEFEQKFKKTRSIEVSKELRAIIEQIRKEVKGEEIRLTVDGKIDINATIQANKTLHESLQKLPINMIVLGLVAAKKKVNPASLISSLTNSYYSQFNGFNELGNTDDIQLPGQYIKQYDWNNIKQLNKEQIIDVEPIEEMEKKIEPHQALNVVNQRDKILNMLNQMKKKAE